MKIRNLLYLCLFMIMIHDSAAQESKFFLKSTIGGLHPDELAALPNYFATLMDNKLKEKYPCAILVTESDIKNMVEWERKKQLVGTGSDQELQTIANAMGVEYLISLELSVAVGEIFIVNGTLIKMRKTMPTFPVFKASARSNFSAKSFDQMNANLKEVAAKIVDYLKNREICYFKGPVNVKITSTFKPEPELEDYSVYCNGMDGTYHKTKTVDNYSENDWSLEKTGLQSAKGKVKFNLNEETKIDETDFCHECSPAKQGARTYYEKTTTYGLIGGDEAGSGVNADTARVGIIFLDNGTYVVEVKAASRQGTKKTVKEVRAEGACDNINQKPVTTTNKIDASLRETFGPFPGNAQSKVLSHKDTIERINPANGVKEVLTYEFKLTRD